MKEKEIKRIDFDDDEREVIVPPYYRVMYVDDEGRKHIAVVNDASYLRYLEDRFGLLDCKFIPAED